MILEVLYNGVNISQMTLPNGIKIQNLHFSVKIESKLSSIEVDEDEFEPHRMFPSYVHNPFIHRNFRQGGIPTRKVIAKNCKGKIIGTYKSCKEAAQMLNLNHNSVKGAIYKNKVHKEKYFFEYQS